MYWLVLTIYITLSYTLEVFAKSLSIRVSTFHIFALARRKTRKVIQMSEKCVFFDFAMFIIYPQTRMNCLNSTFLFRWINPTHTLYKNKIRGFLIVIWHGIRDRWRSWDKSNSLNSRQRSLTKRKISDVSRCVLKLILKFSYIIPENEYRFVLSISTVLRSSWLIHEDGL